MRQLIEMSICMKISCNEREYPCLPEVGGVYTVVVGPTLHTPPHLPPTALCLHPTPPGSSGAALGVTETQLNLPVTGQLCSHLSQESGMMAINFIAGRSWKGSIIGGYYYAELLTPLALAMRT